mgnify:CR=1 FL=1
MGQRIIKFKAKRLDNGEWEEGSLLLSERGKVCIGTMLDSNEENGTPVCFKCREVDPTTACQFTGLKDMKGREIWEHDLIAGKPCGNATLEVRYSRGCFKLFDIDGDTAYFELGHIPLDKSNNLEEFRIVGNVFNKDCGEK